MKLKGSATVYIRCLECGRLSASMRVYFYDDEDYEETVWQPIKLPEDWQIEEETSFFESGDDVGGYCPDHKQEGLV